RGKDVAVLGYIADAEVRDAMRRQLGEIVVFEQNLAGARHEADDRLRGCRAPHPVSAEQADDLALLDVEVHAMQHMALAVIRLQIAHAQHGMTGWLVMLPPRAARGRLP